MKIQVSEENLTREFTPLISVGTSEETEPDETLDSEERKIMNQARNSYLVEEVN